MGTKSHFAVKLVESLEKEGHTEVVPPHFVIEAQSLLYAHKFFMFANCKIF